MTLTFEWFMRTSGDGRTIYGRGHSLPIAQAQARPIPGEPPAQVAGKLAWMRGLAAEAGELEVAGSAR